ncbi:hypothetical protein K0M31_003022, partial [Melipona bicolor]
TKYQPFQQRCSKRARYRYNIQTTESNAVERRGAAAMKPNGMIIKFQQAKGESPRTSRSARFSGNVCATTAIRDNFHRPSLNNFRPGISFRILGSLF